MSEFESLKSCGLDVQGGPYETRGGGCICYGFSTYVWCGPGNAVPHTSRQHPLSPRPEMLIIVGLTWMVADRRY